MTIKQSKYRDDDNDEDSSPSHNKPRLSLSKDKSDKGSGAGVKSKERWRTHRMADDYVCLVGDLMYPKTLIGPYGYDPEEGRLPLDRVTTLGYLLNPLRRPSVIEKWSPFEVAVFEAALTLFGKQFHTVAKYVRSKTTKEVIEFYYDWKKTSHYKQWKKTYIPDERDTAIPEETTNTKEKETKEKEPNKEKESKEKS